MDHDYRLDVLPDDIYKVMYDWYHSWGDENRLALAKLKAMDHPYVIEKVKEFLCHNDPEARCLAARVLLLLDPETTQSLVLPLLDDPDDGVRLCVIADLSDMGHVDEHVVEPLIKRLLEDSNANVRYFAAFLLGEIGDKRAIPALKWVETNDFGKNYEGTLISSTAREALKRFM